MSIKDVTDAVNVQLTTVLTGLSLVVPRFGFGLEAVRLQQDAPRLVWVPVGGPTDRKIVPAADNAVSYDRGTHPFGTEPNPRPLWTRHPVVEAHVWGLRADITTEPSLDYAATEALMQHVLAACQFVASGSVEVKHESWPPVLGATVRRGVELVVGVQFDIPWVDESDTLAGVTILEVIEGTAH